MTGLWKAVHASGNSNKNHALVGGFVFEVVLSDNFIRQAGEFDADVFRANEWGHGLEV